MASTAMWEDFGCAVQSRNIFRCVVIFGIVTLFISFIMTMEKPRQHPGHTSPRSVEYRDWTAPELGWQSSPDQGKKGTDRTNKTGSLNAFSPGEYQRDD